MEMLQKVIETKIRPVLKAHGGNIELVEVTADGWVKVKMTGACSACPGAQQTISEVVETALKEVCPEIKGVVAVTQVSQELIDEALSILRRGKLGHESLH